jgi:hypothetical protein
MAKLLLDGMFAGKEADFGLIETRAEEFVDRVLEQGGVVEDADGLGSRRSGLCRGHLAVPLRQSSSSSYLTCARAALTWISNPGCRQNRVPRALGWKFAFTGGAGQPLSTAFRWLAKAGVAIGALQRSKRLMA